MDHYKENPLQLASDIRSLKLYHTAVFALLFYDYCLTFSAEVHLAWKLKKTTASILFLVNRYSSLGFSVITMLSYFSPPWPPNVCHRYATTESVWATFVFLISAIFLTLRVYVLTRRNKLIVTLLVGHLAAQLGVALRIISYGGYGAPTSDSLPFKNIINKQDFYVCMIVPKAPKSLYDANLPLILSFDTIVFVVTLFTTFTASRTHPTLRWLKIMQRDGFIYFCAIFSCTLVSLLLAYFTRPLLSVINTIPCSIFTTIMVNHLYLSLKGVGQEHNDETELTTFTGFNRNVQRVGVRVMLSTDVTTAIR